MIEINSNGSIIIIEDSGDIKITSKLSNTDNKIKNDNSNEIKYCSDIIGEAVDRFRTYRKKQLANVYSREAVYYPEQTLTLSLGRQSGHTVYLLNNVKYDDVVIIFNTKSNLDYLKKNVSREVDDGKVIAEKLNVSQSFSIVDERGLNAIRGHSFAGKTVWVDNVSYMRYKNPTLYKELVTMIELCSDKNTVIIELG